MRVIKLGFISVVIFSIILLLFSLILPSQVRVSRAVTIYEDAARINSQLKDLRNWKRWNVMLINRVDENIRISENSFITDALTVQLNDTDPIRSIWKRKNGREIRSGFNIIYSSPGSTHIQWYLDFQLNWYPWEKFGSIVFDRQLGPLMEKSLDNLKSIVEDSL